MMLRAVLTLFALSLPVQGAPYLSTEWIWRYESAPFTEIIEWEYDFEPTLGGTFTFDIFLQVDGHHGKVPDGIYPRDDNSLVYIIDSGSYGDDTAFSVTFDKGEISSASGYMRSSSSYDGFYFGPDGATLRSYFNEIFGAPGAPTWTLISRTLTTYVGDVGGGPPPPTPPQVPLPATIWLMAPALLLLGRRGLRPLRRS